MLRRITLWPQKTIFDDNVQHASHIRKMRPTIQLCMQNISNCTFTANKGNHRWWEDRQTGNPHRSAFTWKDKPFHICFSVRTFEGSRNVKQPWTWVSQWTHKIVYRTAQSISHSDITTAKHHSDPLSLSQWLQNDLSIQRTLGDTWLWRCGGDGGVEVEVLMELDRLKTSMEIAKQREKIARRLFFPLLC